jgi:hypothetical protein
MNGDKNKIILRSSNPNFYGDTVIDKSNILGLYIVKGKITRILLKKILFIIVI